MARHLSTSSLSGRRELPEQFPSTDNFHLSLLEKLLNGTDRSGAFLFFRSGTGMSSRAGVVQVLEDMNRGPLPWT